MDPFPVVQAALRLAQAEPRHEQSRQALHRARSRALVEAVGEELRRAYAAEPDVRVFTKYHEGNRADFGLNELLYDVSVCRVGSVESAVKHKTLWYVSEPLWQIESELAKNSREALFDFNKLVLGAAPIKVFVGPIVRDPESFLEVLRPSARRCTGRVYCALVLHPDQWDRAPGAVMSYSLLEGRWERQAG